MSGLRIRPRCRVVVDNDWSGDPDGLVALAHHLLSPGNRVDAVTSSFLDPVFDSPFASASHGATAARTLVDLLGLAVPVHAGHDTPYAAHRSLSAAASAIVAQAARADDLPLFLVSGGPLTNVADALDADPALGERLVLVWVGGALDPDAAEYNRDTDPAAFERVWVDPVLPIWQFPLEPYRRCAYSVAELEHDLGGSGPVGAWLWQQYVDLPIPDFVDVSPVWPLGDSPPVLVTALTDQSCAYADSTRPSGARLRTYTDVDVRLLVGDLLARLRLRRSAAPG